MDYGFPIYRQNKTRKKVVLASDLCWDYYLGIVPLLSDYTSIDELSWSVSGFIL